MQTGRFRFAVWLALSITAAMFLVAWIYDLPVRDADSGVGPTYLRLPAILLAAFLVDVVPRALARNEWRADGVQGLPARFREVVRQRWPMAHVRFVLIGLGAWYLTYHSFRNLKSYVPFVNRRLWDGFFEDVDRFLFFGNDPAELLHALLGTGFAAHALSYVYIAWIVLVPASLAVALVWSRDARAGAWYVTAVAVDWALGVATYFAVPTLGPIYANPEVFTDLAHTHVSSLQQVMIEERYDVLVNPFTADAVQTIAAFASLHVGISVTMALMAELLRLNRWVRISLWVFLALTVVSTVYLGWHYAVDAVGGAVIGTAAVWIAARGTGNEFRRRPVDAQPALAISDVSRRA